MYFALDAILSSLTGAQCTISPSPAFSFAYSAQPYAPISSGASHLETLQPVRFSRALTTASLRIVPPWTTICLPRAAGLLSLRTLYRQFFITEYERPAAISSRQAPSRRTCFTLEFINTVQRVPRSHGVFDRQAAPANSDAEYPSDRAKVSMKDPHPDEQASFISILSMTPSLTNMAFISCPPISRMNETSLSILLAAL